MVALALGAAAVAFAQPALADHDRGKHRGHHKHKWQNHPSYYYHPAPPPVVYYAPPRRAYVVPPPVYYAPQPGFSFNFSAPLR